MGCSPDFADGIYRGISPAESAGDLWHVRQRVFAAKADGILSLRFCPLWHCAHPLLSWGTSIPIEPFEERSNGTGWQSLQENPVTFKVFFGESTARCRTCENATGSIRFKVMMISAVGIGLSGNSEPKQQPVKISATATTNCLQNFFLNIIVLRLDESATNYTNSNTILVQFVAGFWFSIWQWVSRHGHARFAF